MPWKRAINWYNTYQRTHETFPSKFDTVNHVCNFYHWIDITNLSISLLRMRLSPRPPPVRVLWGKLLQDSGALSLCTGTTASTSPCSSSSSSTRYSTSSTFTGGGISGSGSVRIGVIRRTGLVDPDPPESAWSGDPVLWIWISQNLCDQLNQSGGWGSSRIGVIRWTSLVDSEPPEFA